MPLLGFLPVIFCVVFVMNVLMVTAESHSSRSTTQKPRDTLLKYARMGVGPEPVYVVCYDIIWIDGCVMQICTPGLGYLVSGMVCGYDPNEPNQL